MTDPKTLRVLAEAIPPKGASYIAAANPQTITALCDLLTEALTQVRTLLGLAEIYMGPESHCADCEGEIDELIETCAGHGEIRDARAVLDKAAAMGVRG